VRLLVTGAGGFLGRNVLRAARARGHVAVGVVRAATGDIQADVEDAAALSLAVAEAQPDAIVHAAARGVRRGHGLSAEALLDAHLAAGRALGLASRAHQTPVVWVGSCFEYAPSRAAVAEEQLLAPESAYGQAKLAGLRAFEALAPPPHLVARPFHLYGPGEAPERLVPALFAAALGKGENAFGDPAQERDLVFVGDAAQGLVSAAERLVSGPALPAGLSLQLASGAGTPIGAVARSVARLCGVPEFPFQFKGAPPLAGYDPGRLVGAPTRAQALFGWRAQTALEQGLQEYYLGIETPIPE
jgi:nucleoside-diphosphate-sugar epimerase